MTTLLAPTPDAIARAADMLKNGGVIGLPTETVYGLAANANDGEAVARIYTLKDRPQFNPLIVHVASVEQARELVDFNAFAEELANAYWPGPLTFVLPRKKGSPVSELVSAGLPTIAIRCPSHPVAQSVLKACGLPLAAPSANRSGRPSPTSPQHVVAEFGDALPIVLAAGASHIGVESTVVDLTGETPVLLRHGAITAQMIANVLSHDVIDSTLLEDGVKPRSPGQTLKHYAPRLPLRLRAVDVAADEALLAFGKTTFMGVRGGGHAKNLPADRIRNLSENGDLYEAAANLFGHLRQLELSDAKGIAVMDIPDTGIGTAIRDRLERAAGER